MYLIGSDTNLPDVSSLGDVSTIGDVSTSSDASIDGKSMALGAALAAGVVGILYGGYKLYKHFSEDTPAPAASK